MDVEARMPIRAPVSACAPHLGAHILDAMVRCSRTLRPYWREPASNFTYQPARQWSTITAGILSGRRRASAFRLRRGGRTHFFDAPGEHGEHEVQAAAANL